MPIDDEDRDEVVAFTTIERAAPDRDADERAEVREPEPDERGVPVDEQRRDEPEREQAAERDHPAGELAVLLGARLRRADEGRREQGQDEHLLPRVRPARRRVP